MSDAEYEIVKRLQLRFKVSGEKKVLHDTDKNGVEGQLAQPSTRLINFIKIVMTARNP